MGVLTGYESRLHGTPANWQREFDVAQVHVQWDPERTIHGKKLEHRSIQVGLSRHVIRDFTEDWIAKIDDVTPVVRKIRALYLAGNVSRAKDQLPKERVYPVSSKVAQHLGIEA